MSFEPIVKWSGSKRSQAEEIIKRFPRKIDTYYEPFCGGCSVLYRLLQTSSVKVKRFVASDLNSDLIALWNEIENNWERLCSDYASLWARFNKHGLDMNDASEIERRKECFYTIRERLNKEHRPADFLFILRTTTNGMPRYNDKGEFNNSCHFSRPGIDPLRLRRICFNWSCLLKARNVEFLCCSYEKIEPEQGDFVYADSPYAGTKGMYFGTIDFDRYWEWLRNLKCKWAISFDGIRGDSDNTFDVPKDIYARHEYLKAGNSSFERYLGKGRVEEVKESLYLNYVPEVAAQRVIQDCLL